MAQQLANFASGTGVFDAFLYGGAMIDSSPLAGNGDLSLNSVTSSYMKTTTAFTTFANNGSGISFSGWFFPSGAQNVGSTIFDISAETMTISLYYNTSGTLSGLFNGVVVNSTYVIAPNVWHFFCYTVLCTSTNLALQTIYLDNPATNITTQNTALYSAFSQSIGTNYIGYGTGNANGTVYQYFNGKLDDFRFYNRVLTPPEINVLYNYNYGTNTIAAGLVTVSPNYDQPQISVVQIDVSGTFSGLDISRNPAFPGTQLLSLSSANLSTTSGSLWAFYDTNVSPDTSYIYMITPRVGTVTGTMVQLNAIYTTAVTGGNFNILTNGSLPANNTTILSPALSGWNVTVPVGGTNSYNLNAGTGGAGALALYTGTLPSTVTYYVSLTEQPSTSSSLSQFINLYTNTSGFITFFAWGADTTYTSAPYNINTSFSVSLGGFILLNNYVFPSAGTAVPYTAFSLPFTVNTLGTYNLVFTVLNGGASASTVCFSNVQVRSQAAAGVAYNTIDPSMLQLYYTFDSSFGTGLLNNYASGFGVLDASLAVNAMIVSNFPSAIIGANYLQFDGLSYANIGKWTCPAYALGQGFSITGWVYPKSSSAGLANNATICSLNNGTLGGKISIYMNNLNNVLDISFGGVSDISLVAFPLIINRWSFISITCQGITGGKGQYSYYLNDVSLNNLQVNWPNTSAPYTSNYLGGLPSTTTIGTATGPLGNFTGCMEDFRIYNRVITPQDIFSLWSLGFSNTSYTNLIDTNGLNLYFPFEQGSILV